MAPKKKKTVKKKSKSLVPLTPFNYDPPSVYELGVKPHLFVKCKICCTALPHLNFEWPAVPTDLTLAAIKEAIVKRHGGAIPQLTLYKGVAHPEHSLADASDSMTLKDMGVEGAYMSSPDAPLPMVTFYYDFAAACFDDAIATREPDSIQSKHGVSLKLYRKATSPQPPQGAVRQHPGAAGAAAAAAGAAHGGHPAPGRLAR